MLRRLLPDPFILALLATVALASILPARGGGADLVDVLATIAIVLLFFLHGAKLPREAVLAGLKHWRLHLTILAFTFLAFPLMGLAASRLFPGLMPPALWTGILFLCALPSTVQSSIAFTSLARGNVPAAIASASASQIMGIFLTPPIVGLLASAHGGTIEFGSVSGILLQLLLPFLAGHLLRPWIGRWVDANKKYISYSDRSAILISVYSAFSAAVIEGIWSRLPLPSLALLFLVCAVLLAIMLTLTQLGTKLLGFAREDRITAIFCGTKKSIVTGVPMARVLFAGPDMGLVLLPVMIFHQMQLMACAWLARRWGNRTD
ncbi:bile acid:sodium symporter [Sphingomonas oleivorans]|uniref:Bile acid:sodium symporter n=1 Tax=Sphingomonas oleivorans TaxID=1735121 RepID=A0A2T5FVZ5_9SPHN|nr:bile acid:sodium symporter family protein [Sphingomonas oleivorans]PTQ09951.1 bile acid:sodium symporter [Sphingomonas oleivorans]